MRTFYFVIVNSHHHKEIPEGEILIMLGDKWDRSLEMVENHLSIVRRSTAEFEIPFAVSWRRPAHRVDVRTFFPRSTPCFSINLTISPLRKHAGNLSTSKRKVKKGGKMSGLGFDSRPRQTKDVKIDILSSRAWHSVC